MSPVFKAVWFCILLICADFIAGLLIAHKKGGLNFRLLPKFLASEVLPYIGGLLILSFIAYLDPTGAIAGILAVAVTSYGLKLLADLKDKFNVWRGANLDYTALDYPGPPHIPR
ncbi:MAG: hypothetical protein C4570_07860 [Ammonifex sp.]|jgi:hypothetical protein|nr:MAG: hypothetical protein C4570_07860 [Ammonifex sp.]